MLIAGEASGDIHAADVITAIRKLDEQAQIRFFGGDLMAKAARRRPEVHYDQMNVMGFSEVLRKLPQLWRNLKSARQLLAEFYPDVLILIDYPGFNLKMAKYAKSLGIRVDYYISPKVWAWKEYRVKRIKKYVDNMYSILPFEVPFYNRHGYNVTYVGNPSVQEMDYALGHLPPKRHFVERQGLADIDRPIIALLPGSRKGEIRNNLPVMLEAVKRFPACQYVVAAAPAISEKFYREIAQDPGLQVVFGCTPTLLKYSQAALVTSGTATLETALIGTPQVVCYRANGSKLSYKIMERLLKVKYVSLPNLIVNNSVVPELLLHNCTPGQIARELAPLLQPSPRREWQVSGYKNMRRRLGNSSAADYAAELIVDSLRSAGVPQCAADEPDPEAPKADPKPKKRKRKKPKQKPASQDDVAQPQNETDLLSGELKQDEDIQPERDENSSHRNRRNRNHRPDEKSENTEANEQRNDITDSGDRTFQDFGRSERMHRVSPPAEGGRGNGAAQSAGNEDL